VHGGEKATRSVIPVGNQRAMIKDSLDLQCTVNDIVRLYGREQVLPAEQLTTDADRQSVIA